MTRVLLLAVLLLLVAWAFWRLVDGVIETFGGTTGHAKATWRSGREAGARSGMRHVGLAAQSLRFLQPAIDDALLLFR